MKSNKITIDNYSSTSTDISEDNYELKVNEKQLFLVNNILKKIDIDKNCSILDIGCGWGGLLKAFNNLGYKDLTGIDTSNEQIEYAKNYGHIENAFVSDALSFLKENQSIKYDCIFMIDVLEHLDVDYAIELLKNIKKSLSNNGTLVLQTPNGLAPIQAYLYSDITHVRSYTTESFKQILSIAGFDKNSISFNEGYICSTNPKLIVANFINKYFIKYIIMTYLYCSTGSRFGSIYTQNLIGFVKNN